MVAVFKDRNGRCVLRTRLSERHTTFISVRENQRTVSTLPNREFNKVYKETEASPITAILTWIKSTIPLALAAKKEMQMVIAIYRNKIVAKAENIDELPELNSDAIIVNGEEDLQGKDMKALIKLYNTTLPKDERVKVMPDVEGDINAAIVKTWEALEGYEIPEKGATATKSSTPRTERVYDRTNVPLVEGTVMPTQAKVILEVLAKEGPLSKTALEAALDGKITTKQPIGRIVAFYQKRLVDEGYITMS